MVCGYEWREQRTWERFAWLAAHLINISGKRVRRCIKPKELLGRSSSDPIAQHMKLESVMQKLERRKKKNGDGR
jgi:hypothetical protein